MNDNKNLLKNNDSDNLLKNKTKRNFLDIFIEIIGKITLIILLLLIIDYAYSLMFASKPLIILSKENNKYSSIFYDMYICENSKVVKFKNEKFSCTEVDGLPIDESVNNNNENYDNNDINNNSNTIYDNSEKDDNLNKDKNTNKESNSTNDKIIIEDKSSDACAQAIEYYYEDNNYKYYFTCIKSNNIYVIKNNKEYTIKYALNNNIVTMQELIDNGFTPLKESKNLVNK